MNVAATERGALRVSLAGASADDPSARLVVGPGGDDRQVLIDGRPVTAALRRLDGVHARLEMAPDPQTRATEAGSTSDILLLPPAAKTARSGAVRREVVVDGWRFEVEIDLEARAALRERASRGAAARVHEGPFEVRAMIPGRIVSVEVVAGDTVAAGERVMIIEAMKMQNELRVPRDGKVGRVVIGAGQTIEVGDLLLVLE